MSHHHGEGADLQGGPLPGPRRTGDSVKDRVQALLAAVAAAAVGLAVLMGTTTLHSLYPGTGSGWWGPPERAAVAEVTTCQRLGPLSIDGIGYWWICEVTVRVEDGRVVTTVVDHSIVTPADRGRRIGFREACRGGGFTDCSYGRPVAREWKVALAALKLVEWTILAFFVFAIVVLLDLGRAGPPGPAGAVPLGPPQAPIRTTPLRALTARSSLVCMSSDLSVPARSVRPLSRSSRHWNDTGERQNVLACGSCRAAGLARAVENFSHPCDR